MDTKQFTSDPPTEPGWYWWRHSPTGKPEVLYVDWYAGLSPERYSGLHYWSMFRRLSDNVEEARGEWLRADPPGEMIPECQDSRDALIPNVADAYRAIQEAAKLNRTHHPGNSDDFERFFNGDLDRFWEVERLITDAMSAVGKTLDYLERVER